MTDYEVGSAEFGQNYQFELDGVVFGKGAPISIDGEDGFDRGTDEVFDQDVYLEGTESIAFGRDTNSPSLWTFQMHTDTARFADEALRDVALLEKAWRDSNIRLASQEVSTLRYMVGNRVRRVFGRPRRWAASTDQGLMSGYSKIVADFQRADRYYYGDEEFSVDVTATPAVPGGFYTPITFPLTTIAGSSREGTILGDNDGTTPSPFKVTFYGPESGSASDVRLRAGDWEIGLRGELGTDEMFEISTYPFGPRAKRNGDQTTAGWIVSNRALRDVRIPLEGDTLWFDVTDPTGTARCVVSWYSTYDTF